MSIRFHITGASGSGTTTLGRALSDEYEIPHFDSDDFFWLPTDPPYRETRPREERLQLLEPRLRSSDAWVLSGSNRGWGDPLIQYYDLVVFLLVPTEVRLERLRVREPLEHREHGEHGEERIGPGGTMNAQFGEFLDWAAQYDDGPLTMRSLASHREWLSHVACPVLELSGEATVDEHLEAIRRHIQRV